MTCSDVSTKTNSDIAYPYKGTSVSLGGRSSDDRAGRGKIIGFFKKLQAKDDDLLEKLLTS